MRFGLFVTVFLVSIAVAQNPPTSGGACKTPQASSQKSVQEIINEDPGVKRARALLNQMIQAMGGQAYLDLQDMEQQGRAYRFYHGAPNGVGAPYWRFWKRPAKDRVELSKQRDVVYVYDDNQGWEITYKGTRALDKDELQEYLRERDYSLPEVLRKWLKEPGTALFYQGTGLSQDKQVDKVSIINSKDQAVTIAIDQFTHLPVKKTYQIRDPETRELDEEGEVFDNWRPEQGINTAHSIIQTHNGEMARQRFIQSVVYNQGIPDSKFTATVTYTPKKK